MRRAVAFLLLLTSAAIVTASSHRLVSVTQDAAGAWRVLFDDSREGAIAVATYAPTINQTGWNVLNVTTSSLFSDEQQAYAAGFAEGAASYQDIVSAIANAAMLPFPALITYMRQNFEYMMAMVAQNPGDEYWHQVNLTMLQFHGILDGANSQAPDEASQIALFNLWVQAAMGDLIDLVPALNITYRSDWKGMNPAEFNSWLATRTHCSALVKLALDLSDVYFGHATWSSYNFMLRVYKHYRLNFKNAPVKQVSFSSYPGTPVSIDDFYVTDGGLAITETTLNVFNYSIYDGNVLPQSLLYWVRVSVANRMSTTARGWVELFGDYNSGTYNNQWIVLDMKRFVPSKPIPSGTLWISEQMPGMYVTRDVTGILEYGYWPSYNVPTNRTVFAYAGYPEAIATQGPQMLDYELCVRAQIFRRDQANVSDMPAMQYMMQYNNYLNDPISQGNPVYAIASRGDLAPASQGGPQCFGAIDAKLTSWTMYQTGREVLAFSGPTPQEGVFAFSNMPPLTPVCGHQGAPGSFDFLWNLMSPFRDF